MKLEQQLKQLSFSGLAAALLLMVVPEQGVRHAHNGRFLAADVGAGLVAAVFAVPVVRAGAAAANRAAR